MAPPSTALFAFRSIPGRTLLCRVAVLMDNEREEDSVRAVGEAHSAVCAAPLHAIDIFIYDDAADVELDFLQDAAFE